MKEIDFGVSGIYCIRNRLSKDLYIGSSNDIRRRFTAHRSLLRRGLHNSMAMQADWTRLGEDYFEFFVMTPEPVSQLHTAEQFYLSSMTAGYNTVRNIHRHEVTEQHKQRLRDIHRAKHRNIEAFGGVWSMKELAEEYGVKYTLLKDRLRAGWEPEKAVTTPARKTARGAAERVETAFGVTANLKTLHTLFGAVSEHTFRTRVQRGWSIEGALAQKGADRGQGD